MTLELAFAILLLTSLSGMGFILIRKIPALVELPELNFQKRQIISGIKKQIKKGLRIIPGAKKFDYELYLQKALSKIRVLTLKTESKTGSWLEKLRQKMNGHNHDNAYWEELKKAKDGKYIPG